MGWIAVYYSPGYQALRRSADVSCAPNSAYASDLLPQARRFWIAAGYLWYREKRAPSLSLTFHHYPRGPSVSFLTCFSADGKISAPEQAKLRDLGGRTVRHRHYVLCSALALTLALLLLTRLLSVSRRRS